MRKVKLTDAETKTLVSLTEAYVAAWIEDAREDGLPPTRRRRQDRMIDADGEVEIFVVKLAESRIEEFGIPGGGARVESLLDEARGMLGLRGRRGKRVARR